MICIDHQMLSAILVETCRPLVWSVALFTRCVLIVCAIMQNLKQVMMSGLFYMAQDRLDDAEVLFSHALHLPDFQRPEMKAYSLICLAMVLNKKRKNRYAGNSGCIIMHAVLSVLI